MSGRNDYRILVRNVKGTGHLEDEMIVQNVYEIIGTSGDKIVECSTGCCWSYY